MRLYMTLLMLNRMFGSASSSSDSEATDYENVLQRQGYKFRARLDWNISLNKAEFRERMYPQQAEILLNLISNNIKPTHATNHALNSKQRLLVALRFFATNSAYFSVGDAEHISKGTVTKCVSLVVGALNRFDNIDWPKNVNECRKIGSEFFKCSRGRQGNLPGFPLVCGAIDGTLVPIEVPRENDIQYVDRHGNHSINVQGVAGPDLHFFSLSVRWPGSVNDARVFRNSELCNKFDNGYRPFEGAVLLGDSIYPVKDYLVPMRPYPDLEQFFRAHARARRFIECAWGLLKNRFPCLRTKLRMKDPKKSALVIKACVHLHNFIIESRESELDDQELMPDLYQEEGFGRSDPAAADRNLEEEEAEDLAIEEENAFLRNNEMRRIVQKFNEVNKIN